VTAALAMATGPGGMTAIVPAGPSGIELPPLDHLTGAQKAAIVLLKLGKERAAQIMRLLGERDVTRVTAEIVQAQAIRRQDADASLIEFAMMARANDHLASGGIERARDYLEASVGKQRAAEILEGLHDMIATAPFEFLRRVDPRQVINFMSNEHPQTVALVLAHLPPDQASIVLGGLEEKMQRDVSIRIARLEQISPEVIAHLESNLERRFRSTASHQAKVDRADGVQTLIDILNRADRATERAIFEGLEQHESELVDQIRARMFVFEDIVTLDDRAIQLILRNVESKELATALKGTKSEVRDKIKRNMSERAAANLEEEISLLGSVKLSTVEEAQGVIVRSIRALEESGQIVVSRGTDEYVD
jgi:flagellar motor switch protein FliG